MEREIAVAISHQCVSLLQVGLSLPVFGIPINLKSMVRRLCLAAAVAQVMWAVWRHSDLEQETIR